MKKLVLLALGALLLAGCSDARASLKDPKTAVFSVGNQTLTKGDMYNFMLARDAGYFTINEAKKVIFEKEVPVTDEMRSEAEETLNTYKTMLSDSFASYLQSYGFADEEEYLNNSLLVSLQAQELTKVYVNEKFGDLVSRYSPKKIRIMQFTDEATANQALEQVKSGANFEETATSLGSSVSAAETIATTQSSYATNVLSTLSVITDPTLTDVIADDNGANFYIVQVIATDAESFKDEAVDTIASISALSSEASIFYFEKYNFTVYDKTIYDQLESNYADYLIQAKSK